MSFVSPLLESYLLLLEPISKDDLVGKDARYSEAFEEIESSVSSAASLFTNTATDWQRVVDLGEKILTSQAKDIRVLCWFSWGLFKTNSFEGLYAGLHLINGLIEKYWEDIFPTKQKTRISSFEWLASRIEQLFQENISVQEHSSLFKAFLVELRKLDTLLTSKWQDNSPLLLPTCRRLERMLADTESDKEPKESVVEKVITQAKGIVTNTVASKAVSFSSLDNERDANKLLRTLQENGRSLCVWWLNQRPTDLKALRLNRTLLWLVIEALPDNKDNLTTLRPVPLDKVNNYKERLNQGRYSDLIIDVEISISKAPFWIDGQHIVWQCLNSLRMDAAMLEVEIQLALFLERIPNLIELQFHDGTPFANENTIAWINDHVLPKVRNKTTQLSAPVLNHESTGKAKWDEVLQGSIDSLVTNGLKESMSPMVAGLKAATGGREKFFWRLCMAKLCLADKRYELAKTQLENLDDQACELGVDQWEPALVLEVIYLLYKCCELLPQSQQVREDKERLYKRLCFLNMDLIMDES